MYVKSSICMSSRPYVCQVIHMYVKSSICMSSRPYVRQVDHVHYVSVMSVFADSFLVVNFRQIYYFIVQNSSLFCREQCISEVQSS